MHGKCSVLVRVCKINKPLSSLIAYLLPWRARLNWQSPFWIKKQIHQMTYICKLAKRVNLKRRVLWMAINPIFSFSRLRSFILRFLHKLPAQQPVMWCQATVIAGWRARVPCFMWRGFMQRTEMTHVIHLHIYFLSRLFYQTGMENNASNFIDTLT